MQEKKRLLNNKIFNDEKEFENHVRFIVEEDKN